MELTGTRQPAPCRGCDYSKFSGTEGISGAWKCRHPDNPKPHQWPALAVALRRPGKPLVCAISTKEDRS